MKVNKDILWFFFFLVLFSLGLCSCSTLEKRISKAKVIAYENPQSFAEFCATKFPVNERYVKGKDSIITKTVVIKGDTIPCPVVEDKNGNKIQNKVVCPDVKYIDTGSVRVDTVFQENTAKLSDIQQRFDKKVKEYDAEVKLREIAEKKATARVYWIAGLALISVMAIYMLIKTNK